MTCFITSGPGSSRKPRSVMQQDEDDWAITMSSITLPVLSLASVQR